MDNELKDKGQRDKIKETALLKAQKLASAMYIVTGFLHDSDSLKWKLRDGALTLAISINPENPEASVEMINRLATFLDIGLSGSQVSKMNFSILKEEYLALARTLLDIPPLVIPEPVAVPLTKPAVKELAVKFKPSGAPDKGQIMAGANPRRDQILAFIRQHDGSSIKDIARAVPEFSSKTVQRELADLVRLGTVKREGDRRWSRYSLI